ncbi:hypothetical protein AAFF_G00402380, partial [Aldrovandia affinis]
METDGERPAVSRCLGPGVLLAQPPQMQRAGSRRPVRGQQSSNCGAQHRPGNMLDRREVSERREAEGESVSE